MTNPNSGQEGSAGKVLSEDELAAIEARWKAATPRPWFKGGFDQDVWCGIPGTDGGEGNTMVIADLRKVNAQANGRFIEYAIDDIPNLLATIRHLQAEARAREPLVRAANDYRLAWKEWDREGQTFDSDWRVGVADALHRLATIARSKATDDQGA